MSFKDKLLRWWESYQWKRFLSEAYWAKLTEYHCKTCGHRHTSGVEVEVVDDGHEGGLALKCRACGAVAEEE